MRIDQINKIERNCKMVQDFRNDDKNSRKSIYEIVPNKNYVLVHKIKGQYAEVISAQNALLLVIRHFKP